jgi:sulfotransferase family protein
MPSAGLSAAELLKLPGEAAPSWAIFDPSWYVRVNSAVCRTLGDTSAIALLSFYVQVGQGQGHSPNRYFDETWYCMAYPNVVRGVQDAEHLSGFDHYCRHGHRTLAPHWLFSEQYYRDQNPDLTDEMLNAANVANGYDHFLRRGAQECRRAHPFFDPEIYQAGLGPDAARVSVHAGPFHHFLDRIESGRYELRTSQYFDPTWYLLRYPEIASAIERGAWRCALHHYLANDTPTRFDPSPEFSEALYLSRYPDVAAAVQLGDFRNGYAHFIHIGLAEGRLAEGASEAAPGESETSTGKQAPALPMEQSPVTSEGSRAGAEAPAEHPANALPSAERNTNELTERLDEKTSSDNTVPLPDEYQGHLDACTTTRLRGWGTRNGMPAELDVLVNDRTIARIRCRWRRPDLVPHGLPINAGFEFVFDAPIALFDKVSVRFADGPELTNSPNKPLRVETAGTKRTDEGCVVLVPPSDPESGVARSSLDHSSNGIVILGMHRSGTSLLAQLLYHWGAFIDTAGMLESNIFNPRGYWEPAPLVRFNDQLLSILQSRWSVPPRDDAKILMAAMANQDRLRQRAVDLLTAAYAGRKPWFWKDPRLAILLPFWKHFLGDVLYFVSLREPGDIARSLSSRDSISIPDSLLLWQKYMLDILADEDVQSTGIFLIYENLLADPPGECARLCRLLDQRFGVSAPHPDDRLERMVAAVDAALWRNRSQAAFTENPFATAVQKRLYSALIERAAGTVRIAPQDFPLPADWRVELSNSDSWRGMGLTTAQCQVYWRAAHSWYSEADSDSVRVSMEGQPQFLKIPIPGSGDGAAAIRVDLTDRPALVWVTQMELRDSADNVIWAWDRCADSMARLPQNEIASCTSLPGESGCRLELPGYDSWIEIVLDQSQTAATREGATMVLQCTYSASLAYAQFVHVGRIHEVLSRLDDIIAWLQQLDDRQANAQAAAQNRPG